jgi:lipoyl(octanoyl) transferase
MRSSQTLLVVGCAGILIVMKFAAALLQAHPFIRPPGTGHLPVRDMIAPQQLGSFEELVLEQGTPRLRRVRCCDYTVKEGGGAPIEYHAAWNLQKELLQSHLDRLARDNNNDDIGNEDDDASLKRGDGVDTILLLEHTPVYTLGTGSDANFIQATTNAVPVVRMDRGGEVTYHGPGQLTVYPILDLRNGYRADIHWYVRALEEVVLRAVAQLAQDRDRPSLVAHREPDVTGVWIEDCKVAAVGVKCRKWITQHGFAINVTPESMQYMDGIVPCGLVGRNVGYINQFLTSPVTVAEMASYVRAALEEVFQIQLVDAEISVL